MPPPVIVDTGVLYAALDRDDKHHEICADWMRSQRTKAFIVPALVIAEVCYWLHESELRDNGESTFLAQLSREEQFQVYTPTRKELLRMSQLVLKYHGLGGTDASVVAAAEKFKTADIATIDRRHFAQIVPDHTGWFNLHPDGLVP